MKSRTDPIHFRHPAVRHLAWMCRAPQLLSGPLQFDLAAHMPQDALARLERWDREPEKGPAVLTEPPHRRLGLYFERLYECVMTELLGWEVLARNLPVRSETRTLGELDCLVRDPSTQAVEHHEIAVKFYLGHEEPETGAALWYGPNARDRLDIKTRRLLEHQSQLSQLAETRAVLASMGVHEELTPRIFMPGYLFYPLEPGFAPPLQAPDDHERGYWLYAKNARQMNIEHWVQLRKPHWLGPWVQTDSPDPAQTRAALDSVQSTGTPRLFAHLERDDQTKQWSERDRLFVVPDHWPASHWPT